MSKLVKLTAALLLSVTFANADSSQADAKALVEKGVEFCKKVGVAACVEEFNKPESQFVKDDLYIWANDFDGIITAHPKKPLKGKNLYRYKDKAGNQLFKEFIDKVKADGSGWVDYPQWYLCHVGNCHCHRPQIPPDCTRASRQIIGNDCPQVG